MCTVLAGAAMELARENGNPVKHATKIPIVLQANAFSEVPDLSAQTIMVLWMMTVIVTGLASALRDDAKDFSLSNANPNWRRGSVVMSTTTA